MQRCLFLLFCFFFPLIAAAQHDQLMPVPQSMTLNTGQFRLSKDFAAAIRQKAPSRLGAALPRMLRRLDGRTALNFADFPSDLAFPINGLNVWIRRKGDLVLREDESYTLTVNARRIMLEAETDLGALHGLETLLQLLDSDAEGWFFPACRIEDAPRFPWRGLLIDVCRHWQPVEVIKRNLDGMAAMKMNVFHWHLSEDQGFRIESKAFPALHELGSNGDYFTQDQVREIIAYADARGIRVVPEFDIPGHATSWFVGHPELASAPGPYAIEKGFGVFDPAMDPTRESTYAFLEKFLGEMCALFPDAYFHIGGDENNGKHWDANENIQAYMRANDIKDNHALQSYFNQRLLSMLTENGKQMIGWDEILQPDMPTNIVIHSWRGLEGLVKAASQGYDVMLSGGYYIDLCKPAAAHYLNDPLPADSKLDEKAKAHILGGEATMWAELVSPETIDSRIWPRTCAIAERLWSPGTVRDVADMYRRLPLVSLRLEEVGLTHLRNPEMLMRRACNGQRIAPLQTLLQVVEPVKVYARHHQGLKYSTDLPLVRLPDMAVPDARVAREFSASMTEYLEAPDDIRRLFLHIMLENWRNNHARLVGLAAGAPALREVLPLSEKLRDVAIVGIALLEMHAEGGAVVEKKAAFEGILEAARKPDVECELMVVDAVEALMGVVFGG